MNTAHQLIVAGFGGVTGASVGSFVNVCVWRLPRGESLLRPKSRCPRCETPISPRDNVPVIGWLALRGRCRACKLPIAKRYPLVEASVGVLFALVALAEISGPVDPIDRGLLWFSASLLYHWMLVALLVTMGLIEYDRRPAPMMVGSGGAELVATRHRHAIAIGLAASVGVLAAFAATADGIGAILNLGLILVFFHSLRD